MGTGGCLLLAVKQNLSASADGLAFQIETQNNAPRLNWEPGAVQLPANEVLGNGDVQQDPSERREARAWLQDFLADGPVAVKKIQSESKAAGLSWATVRRAKDTLQVIASKSNFSGGWQWRLEDAQRQDAHPMHTQMSTLEQCTENTKLNGNRADEDAHRSNVSAFNACENDDELRL
jgi:putative DNA primase/helicase